MRNSSNNKSEYNNQTNSSRSNSQPSDRRALNANNGVLVCQICNKEQHDALHCYNRYNHSYQANDVPQALAALAINEPFVNEWLPDTGVIAHMTGPENRQDLGKGN